MLSLTTYNIPETVTKETYPPEKWLWILVQQDISVAEEVLLRNIVKALKADYESEAQIFFENQLRHSGTVPQGHPAVIVSFGVMPSAIGYWIDMPAAGIRFLEKTSIILTAGLKTLDESPVAKKQLWSFMQQIPERTPTS